MSEAITPRTGVRYVVQTKGTDIPWRDIEGLPRYKSLYEAIRVKDSGIQNALGDDPFIRLLQAVRKDIGLVVEVRVVKRTITVVDEVVDESEVIPMPEGK